MSEEHIAYATKYGEPIDCTWIITADPGSQIFIQFAEFELAMPNDCNFNYIQVGTWEVPLSFHQPVSAFRRRNRHWGSNHHFLWLDSGIKNNRHQHLVCKVSWLFSTGRVHPNFGVPRYFAEAKGIGSEFAAWFSVLKQQVTDSIPFRWTRMMLCNKNIWCLCSRRTSRIPSFLLLFYNLLQAEGEETCKEGFYDCDDTYCIGE